MISLFVELSIQMFWDFGTKQKCFQGCWLRLKLQQSGAKRRQAYLLQVSVARWFWHSDGFVMFCYVLLFESFEGLSDSEAMDGAFSALSWDDSAVKVRQDLFLIPLKVCRNAYFHFCHFQPVLECILSIGPGCEEFWIIWDMISCYALPTFLRQPCLSTWMPPGRTVRRQKKHLHWQQRLVL